MRLERRSNRHDHGPEGEYETQKITITRPECPEGIKALWVRAKDSQLDRSILYVHGGGYCLGSIKTHKLLAARISISCGFPVLLFNYRLAPEYPYPAGECDVMCAYRWLLEQPQGDKIVVAGDSAGAGLALGSMIKLHAEGVTLPAALACISPHTDLAGTGDSMRTRAGDDPYLTPKGIKRLVKAYLKRTGIAPNDPRVSAIYADLTGLPPLLIQVGTDEILYDDSTRLRDRAEHCGVCCTFRPWDDMWHVWHSFACRLEEGQDAIDELGEFVKSHL